MFSEADLRAEQTVREMLSAFRPDYGFLGEEGGLVPGADRDNVWIVDPLDGTTNFLIGLPLFAVNIALANAGQGRRWRHAHIRFLTRPSGPSAGAALI